MKNFQKHQKKIIIAGLVVLVFLAILSISISRSNLDRSRLDLDILDILEAQAEEGNSLILFWDGDIIPTGWTCISCLTTDPFYQVFPRGAPTYGVATSGAETHTHTVTWAGSTGPSLTTTCRAGTDAVYTADDLHTHDTLTAGSTSATSTAPRYRSLKMIKYDLGIPSGPSAIPNGAIALFATSSLPTNWAAYTLQDGYFVRGDGAITTGGANTHTHTVDITTGPPSATAVFEIREDVDVLGMGDDLHTHSAAGAGPTSVEDHRPPYIEVVFGQAIATTTIHGGMIGLFDAAPTADWDIISDLGDDFYQRFIVASSTAYGATGGAETHTHANLTITTGGPSTTVDGNNSGPQTAANAPGHTHDITVSFSTESNLPVYRDVIIAKYYPFVQNYYRFYENVDAIQPITALALENTPITGVANTDVIRIRMSLQARATTSLIHNFKLQYATSTDCPTAVDWSDVGGIGSTAIWRGYDNLTPADGATTTANLLSVSDILERYEEENPATTTNYTIYEGQDAEWDWVVQNNGAPDGTDYCFRMVYTDGTTLESYSYYPHLTTGLPEPVVSGVGIVDEPPPGIDLIENTTLTVYATATIEDSDGWDDVVWASSTIFRSGVTYTCPADNNNCYQIATSSCVLGPPTTTISVSATCTADIYFHADPTDLGSPWEAENWLARITATDAAGLTGSATSTTGVEMNTLQALDVSPTIINYGSLLPGEIADTDPLPTSTDVTTTGNTAIDVDISGTLMCTDYPTCAADTIATSSQKYATSSVAYGDVLAYPLQSVATTLEVDLAKPTSSPSQSIDIVWWGLQVPISTPAGGPYEGENTFSATAD